MAAARPSRNQVRLRSCCYRGFQLTQQHDLSWRVDHNKQVDSSDSRSFTTPPSSLADVKALIDWRLKPTA
jgi:hypothetical protein